MSAAVSRRLDDEGLPRAVNSVLFIVVILELLRDRKSVV